ncbi:MAG: MgtC/SapB family protein [Candidatus Aminicenantaceae bacterium]
MNINILEITLKLLLALALGGLVGIERESSHKPAGFRTNILICLGATMIMILSDLILSQADAAAGDATRLAAGVVTGIGFLGAGTIIQSRGTVTGLTTAATLWAVGGLGLVIGAGFYLPAVIYTTVIVLTLFIFRRFEDTHFSKSIYRYTLKTRTAKETLVSVKKLALHEGIRFKEFSHKREGSITIIAFSFQAPEDREQKFNQGLGDMDGITELKID